jgi:hypothetical protein
MSTAYYGRAVPLALRRFARFSESNSIPVRFSSQAATSSIHMWVPVAAGEAAMSPAQSKQAESNSDSLERTGWTGLACREYIFSIFLVLSSFCLCQGFVTSRWTSDRQDLSSKHCDPLFSFKQNSYASIWSRCARCDAHDKTEAHWACRFLARRQSLFFLGRAETSKHGLR